MCVALGALCADDEDIPLNDRLCTACRRRPRRPRRRWRRPNVHCSVAAAARQTVSSDASSGAQLRAPPTIRRPKRPRRTQRRANVHCQQQRTGRPRRSQRRGSAHRRQWRARWPRVTALGPSHGSSLSPSCVVAHDASCSLHAPLARPKPALYSVRSDPQEKTERTERSAAPPCLAAPLMRFSHLASCSASCSRHGSADASRAGKHEALWSTRVRGAFPGRDDTLAFVSESLATAREALWSTRVRAEWLQKAWLHGRTKNAANTAAHRLLPARRGLVASGLGHTEGTGLQRRAPARHDGVSSVWLTVPWRQGRRRARSWGAGRWA